MREGGTTSYRHRRTHTKTLRHSDRRKVEIKKAKHELREEMMSTSNAFHDVNKITTCHLQLFILANLSYLYSSYPRKENAHENPEWLSFLTLIFDFLGRLYFMGNDEF